MKKLTINPNIFEFDLTNPQFITIVVENKEFYWKFSKYLYDIFPDHIKYCSFFVNGEEKKIEDVATYIPNLLNLSLNTKQNLNALYKILKKSYFEELSKVVEEIQAKLIEACGEIKLDFDAELIVDSAIRIEDIFKIGGIQFPEPTGHLLEDLVKFVKACKELKGTHIIFVNHLHDYLENSKLSEFIKEIQYHGISLINLETSRPDFEIEGEKTSIIDKDLCSIS